MIIDITSTKVEQNILSKAKNIISTSDFYGLIIGEQKQVEIRLSNQKRLWYDRLIAIRPNNIQPNGGAFLFAADIVNFPHCKTDEYNPEEILDIFVLLSRKKSWTFGGDPVLWAERIGTNSWKTTECARTLNVIA